MKRKILGFHQDAQSDWVAELECGHQQHVRHNPPWTTHPWVLTPEGRAQKLGVALECKDCDVVPLLNYLEATVDTDRI